MRKPSRVHSTPRHSTVTPRHVTPLHSSDALSRVVTRYKSESLDGEVRASTLWPSDFHPAPMSWVRCSTCGTPHRVVDMTELGHGRWACLPRVASPLCLRLQGAPVPHQRTEQ